MDYPAIIDTAKVLTNAAPSLFSGGVRVVIRYYTSDPDSWKILNPSEAEAIAKAGLGVAAVYQVRQTKPEDFGRDKGDEAGRIAKRYARDTIGQPPGSAIYFAVDYDASKSDLDEAIVPYFEAARAQLREGDPGQRYRIGVYGSGLVCQTLLDEGLVELAWLAGASAWRGSRDFVESDRWAIHQRRKTTIEGVEVDPNDLGKDRVDFGQFYLAGPQPAAPARSVGTYRVTARWLNVRPAPTTNNEPFGSLRNGTEVEVVGFAGDDYGWAALAEKTDSGQQRYTSARYLEPV